MTIETLEDVVALEENGNPVEDTVFLELDLGNGMQEYTLDGIYARIFDESVMVDLSDSDGSYLETVALKTPVQLG